jgi:hypothetical protein
VNPGTLNLSSYKAAVKEKKEFASYLSSHPKKPWQRLCLVETMVVEGLFLIYR